jgi:hypothetical protein
VATGATKKGRFAKRRRLAATFSTFARLSPVLLICADLAIATVPAAAQSFSFAALGSQEGWGRWDCSTTVSAVATGTGGEDWVRRDSCSTADLVLPDKGSKGGLLGASPGDSRSFANDPLSAPMAGSNEVLLIGRVTDNRRGLARGSSQREGTAATGHVVQLIPLGGVKDIRPRSAPWKSRRGGGRHMAPVMATSVPPKKVMDRIKDNPNEVMAQNPSDAGGYSVLSTAKVGHGRLPCGGIPTVPTARPM